MENLNWFDFNFNTFLWVFIVLNVVNVVIQTYKSIITINGSKMGAAIVNAITYAVYTVVVVFMNAEGLGLFWKAFIIGVANFFGVYVVKLVEEKARKDKLWKIEATVSNDVATALDERLDTFKIPHSYIVVGSHTIFNCYCATQKESSLARDLLNSCNAKYFVSESKTL